MSRIPDPNALRRDRKDDAAWTVLDPNGKVEPAPPWPLVTPSERELELWEITWKRPQSVLWVHYQQELEVALYTRRLSEVELREANASLHTLLIRQMESLLLTTPSMYRAKVRIGTEVHEPDEPRKAKATEATSLKKRLALVQSNK